VLAYSISLGSETDSTRGQANRRTLHTYLHIDPSQTLISVFELPQEHSLVIDTPIECLPNGGITVLVMGDQPTITNAVGAFPDSTDTELLATGEYRPTDRALYSTLTPRQQEILTTAVEAGYYNVPREITHEGLADRLDLAAVTVGEHLRKIEARIFGEIVR
jgi:predicted DNA binding protein